MKGRQIQRGVGVGKEEREGDSGRKRKEEVEENRKKENGAERRISKATTEAIIY